MSRLLQRFRDRVAADSIGPEELFVLGHIYSLSTTWFDRRDIFGMIGARREIYGRYSEIFRSVYNLSKGWGYDLYTALQQVLATMRRGYAKRLLTILSQIIVSGADLAYSMLSELRAAINSYDAVINRRIDATRILFSLYSTFMSVSVFVLVNVIMLAMLVGGGDEMVVLGATALNISVAALGAVVIAMAPKDAIALKGTLQYRRIVVIPMIGVIVSSISFMLSSMLIGFGTPVSVALFTAPLIASGWIALRIENRLLQIDEIFASFLRSLGAILSSTTLLEALRDMTTTVLGILTPYVVRLIRMIRMEVGVENAWREILSELGSRITSFAGTVFLEAYRSQGDIKGSGNALGDIIDAVMRGRKREIQMARSYEATAIMLTALVSAIMGFVISLVGILTYYISSLGGTIFSIAAVSPYLMDLLSYITIVIISIVNGLVVRSTYPGSLYSATYHIGIFIVVGYTSYQASIIASDMIIRSFLTELPKIPGF